MGSYERELEKAQEAAREAGKIIRKSYATLRPSDITEKRLNDLVTIVDFESQDAIVSILRENFPDDFIIAEENLKPEVNQGIDAKRSRRWYIDPLDGTTNYIHAFPVFAASLGLEEPDGNRVVLGVTFDPLRDELYHAVRGEGAFLNNKRIEVSGISDKSKTLFLTGFPFRSRKYLDDYLKTFKFFFNNARGVRRAGSATLDLAYVAAGRAEAFWELTLSPWDMAAGIVLIEEAGGRVTDFFGGDDSLRNGHIVASNGIFHDWMCEEIQKAFPKGGEYTVD
jgi:myo-inositol-1(or 4)-monophosphatase